MVAVIAPAGKPNAGQSIEIEDSPESIKSAQEKGYTLVPTDTNDLQQQAQNPAVAEAQQNLPYTAPKEPVNASDSDINPDNSIRVAKDGKEYHITNDPESIASAKAKGYQFVSDYNRGIESAQAEEKKHEQGVQYYQKQLEDKGALGLGAGSADAMALGLGSPVQGLVNAGIRAFTDKTDEDKLQSEYQDEAKERYIKEHEGSYWLGKIPGEIALLFGLGGAEKLAQGGLEAIALRATELGAKGLGETLVHPLTKLALQGAIYSSPSVVEHTLKGDYAGAGEALATGELFNAGLHFAGSALAKPAEKVIAEETPEITDAKNLVEDYNKGLGEEEPQAITNAKKIVEEHAKTQEPENIANAKKTVEQLEEEAKHYQDQSKTHPLSDNVFKNKQEIFDHINNLDSDIVDDDDKHLIEKSLLTKEGKGLYNVDGIYTVTKTIDNTMWGRGRPEYEIKFIEPVKNIPDENEVHIPGHDYQYRTYDVLGDPHWDMKQVPQEIKDKIANIGLLQEKAGVPLVNEKYGQLTKELANSNKLKEAQELIKNYKPAEKPQEVSDAEELLKNPEQYTQEYKEAQNKLLRTFGVTPAKQEALRDSLKTAMESAGIDEGDDLKSALAKFQKLEESGPAIGKAIKLLDTADGKENVINNALAKTSNQLNEMTSTLVGAEKKQATKALKDIKEQITAISKKDGLSFADTQGLKRFVAEQTNFFADSKLSDRVKRQAYGILRSNLIVAEDSAATQIGGAEISNGLKQDRGAYAMQELFGDAIDKAENKLGNKSSFLESLHTQRHGVYGLLGHLLLPGHGTVIGVGLSAGKSLLDMAKEKSAFTGAVKTILKDSNSPASDMILESVKKQDDVITKSAKGLLSAIDGAKIPIKAGTTRAISEWLPNNGAGKSKSKQLTELREMASQEKINPAMVANHLANLTAPLRKEGLDAVADAYTDHQLRLMKVIQMLIPNDDSSITNAHPFSANVERKEITADTEERYKRALTVAIDPTHLCELVKNNQITTRDVAIATATNPSTLQKLRNALIDEALKAKPDLSYQHRLSLGIALGVDLDQNTEQLPIIQGMYSAQAVPQGGGKSKMNESKAKDISGNYLTSSQKAFKGSQ